MDLNLRLVVIVLCVGPPIYFLPAILAATQGHDRAHLVFWLNLLLGWTVIGWVAALAWTVMTRPEPDTAAAVAEVVPRTNDHTAILQIAELSRQRRAGAISPEEFESRTAAILQQLPSAAVRTRRPFAVKAAVLP